MWPIGRLSPYSGNSRTHTKAQIRQIAASIERFGFINPILADRDGEIVAGHGRWSAAKELGLEAVPVLQTGFLSEADKRAYRLADNRLAELAGWDEELLKIEFELLIEADLDPVITGFEIVDIDNIIRGEEPRNDPADEIDPEPDRNSEPISRPGDLWMLGEHRIFCGNALEEESYKRLLEEERAQLVITDPPYNVEIDGHVCGLGSVRHKGFAMASGEMSAAEFTGFLGTAFTRMAAFSQDGAIHFIFMDWRHLAELYGAADPVYEEIKNLIVWVKTNAGMGSFYRSQHELILAAKVGRAPHINNFKLGSKRYRTNVWSYPGVNTFRKGRLDDLKDHPTVKPAAMTADAIRDCSKPKGIVLDPFLGSGTTVLAAEKTGRKARGIELDPGYVDVAIRRWQTLTGETAIHQQNGRSFDDIERNGRARHRPPPHGCQAIAGRR